MHGQYTCETVRAVSPMSVAAEADSDAQNGGLDAQQARPHDLDASYATRCRGGSFEFRTSALSPGLLRGLIRMPGC